MPEQAAAVRRRRDRPDLRDHARSGPPATCCGSSLQETLAELATAACQARRRARPDRVLRGRPGRQRHHRPGPRHRPEPLGVAPFILSTRLPEIRAHDLGVPAHPQARAVVFPRSARTWAVTSRRPAGQQHGPRPAGPPVHRHRHQLRDRPRRPATGCWPRQRRSRPRLRRSASIRCGMRAADGVSRRSRSPATAELAHRHRRHRPRRPVRLRPGRRGRRSYRGRPHRLLRPVHPEQPDGALPPQGRGPWPGAAPGGRPPLTTIGEERVFVLHWSADRDPAASVYLSQHATSASSSSTREPAHRHRLAHPARRAEPLRQRTSSRSCSPAPSAPTSTPSPPSASAWSPT